MDADQPIFYYDLGSPECYLVAETIMSELPVVPEWEPVLGAALGAGGPIHRIVQRSSGGHRALEPTALALATQSWPPDTREAMLAATYAKRGGRAVAFSLAAFRQAFAAGRDLGDQNTVLIAAAACEMHPTAVLKGIGLRSVAGAPRRGGAARPGGGSPLAAGDPGRRARVRGRPGCIESAAIALGAAA